MVGLPFETEQILRAEIAPLIEKYPNNKELYREVCALLFFRFNITPTANLVYGLVGRGTMSTPADAVHQFWKLLREKSRIRIEHPDLPAELAEATGAFAAEVWEKATQLAAKNLEAYRDEAQQSSIEAQRQVEAVIEERALLQEAFEQLQLEKSQSESDLDRQKQQNSALVATIQALERQLSEQGAQLNSSRASLEEARKDFAVELDKVRADVSLAEDRLAKDHARMLMEIEKERQQTVRLKGELEEARTHSRKSDESWRTTLEKAHRGLGDARERVGELEGRLQFAESGHSKALTEIDELRELNTTLRVELARLGGTLPAQSKPPSSRRSLQPAAPPSPASKEAVSETGAPTVIPAKTAARRKNSKLS